MTKAEKLVEKHGHPAPQMRSTLARVNAFYAHSRGLSESTLIEARIIKVVLGDGFGGCFELELEIESRDPLKPELSIRSNDGRLVIRPEVANKITVRAEE